MKKVKTTQIAVDPLFKDGLNKAIEVLTSIKNQGWECKGFNCYGGSLILETNQGT